MSPFSQIDISRMLNRVAGQANADCASVMQPSVERRDERQVQVRALVTGTLLFVPFLIGYFIACAAR